jgi:hypothetical protein
MIRSKEKSNDLIRNRTREPLTFKNSLCEEAVVDIQKENNRHEQIKKQAK